MMDMVTDCDAQSCKAEKNSASAAPVAVALFSGGLDSILAARMLMDQGFAVRCLHFVTPFFGKPERIAHWEAVYGLSIEAVDIGDDFVRMLRHFPEHGYGKVMNPCVDCKILMIRKAREIMVASGAACIVSGEVLGQRPMSQRRDTLNIIRREAGVRDELLRPLCAQHLDPTAAELSGLVDRSRLGSLSGRGRSGQLELARHMGLTEIPTPAGGCRLAEKENARRYWPVLTSLAEPAARDFALANLGRQFWHQGFWLSMGRNRVDNDALLDLLGWKENADGYTATGTPRFGGAMLLRMTDVPGPLALLRPHPAPVPPDAETLRSAAALLASYAPQAARTASSDGTVGVSCLSAAGEGPCTSRVLHVVPCRQAPGWGEPSFDEIKASIKEQARLACGL